MQQTTPVTILGGGPAGASAALAALACGASVRLIEKSRMPRHKVCGEFFSPGIQVELQRLGVWSYFQNARPARVERMVLHFALREKQARLPETAWGLSRYVFDALLVDRARERGAEICRANAADRPSVIAAGRHTSAPRRGQRSFGFKAHFEGPTDDAVELFFFQGCYAGLSPIESGKTNVCGLGPESFLGRHGFDYDAVAAQSPALAARLKSLNRITPWFSTGPLEYRQAFTWPHPRQYPAGDALSFVDPFTGSGLLAAVRTGALAGSAAAHAMQVEDYLADCREALKKPFAAAQLFRRTLDWGWAEQLAGLVPMRVLFALTRPQ